MTSLFKNWNSTVRNTTEQSHAGGAIVACSRCCVFVVCVVDRELERTITALLARGQEAEAAAAASEQVESDEAIAKRMQAELDAEAARNASSRARGGAGAGAGFGSTGGPGEDIDEEELMRLKLAQFAHREAIYQTNSEGPFAPKGAAAIEAASSPASSRGLKKIGKHSSSTLSPMERIARDHKIYETSFHNRVASEEEIAAAKEGPKAMRKLQEKRDKEAKAMQAMADMGFTVTRPQDSRQAQGQAVAQANQAMLAARQGANWNQPHAMAAPAAPMQLPPTYLSDQRAAASEYGIAAAPSAAASAASASSAAAASPSAFDVEKDRKKHKKSKDKADRDAEGDGSKKKKKKKDKDKDRDRAEGEAGDEGDKKKKKKKDKDKEKEGAGAGVASPTAAAPAASSASAASSPVDLVDLLRDYSTTPSSRRVDAGEIATLLKKG